MPKLDDSIQYLKGVGPALAKKFAKLGVHTVRDLLFHYPRRYVDYTRPYAVAEAPYDVDCCVRAEVLQKEPARRIKGGRVLTRVLAADDSGTLTLSWFNAPYVAEHLEIGQSYYFEGRVGGSLTRREILHPAIRTQADVAAARWCRSTPAPRGCPAGASPVRPPPRWTPPTTCPTRCRLFCLPDTACPPARRPSAPSTPPKAPRTRPPPAAA